MYFFDWLDIEQDFDQEIPLIAPRAYQNIDVETSELGKIVQPGFQHTGSYSTSIRIAISGSRIRVSGNPSRLGRLDNLFGLATLDECVEVYNRVLRTLGVPEFTKCTEIFYRTGKDGKKVEKFSNGAWINEVHITTNRATGEGNADDYLKGLSTQPYRNAIPRLHSNGKTVDWLSKRGNAFLVYPSVYNKANELKLHAFDKIKRLHGVESAELKYLQSIIDFCTRNGVVRFEQKIKGRQLSRMDARFWGLFDQSVFEPIQQGFLALDQRLKVNSMTFEGIAEKLISSGVVDTTLAANTSAGYALQWMHGRTFDTGKTAVRTHRSRLRKVGIDIARPCNLATFSPIFVTRIREVSVTDLHAPAWYHHASARPLLRVAS